MSTLAHMKTSDSKPTLTVHVVILRYTKGQLEGLFIESPKDDENGLLTLPSAVILNGETPRQTLKHLLGFDLDEDIIELAELSSLWPSVQDDEDWSVSLTFLGLLKPNHAVKLNDQRGRSDWYPLSTRPQLKRNLADILDAAIVHLRQRINVDTYPLALLPATFRTKQARQLYSQILGQPVAPRPFKAWLRRRQAVTRTGPARFRRNGSLNHDWLLD